MKQRRINFIGMLIFLLFLFIACGGGSNYIKQNIDSSEYPDIQDAGQLSIEEWHTFLNIGELLKLSLKEEEERQISQILLDNQSEYVRTPYPGELVPQELVNRLEEALYAYCKFGEEGSDQPYRELLNELGGGSYRMAEEEIQAMFTGTLPDQAFTFKLSNGKRLYLKSYFLENGGTSCYLWSKSGGEWIREGDFTTTFTKGEVICYENTYYYVGLERDREIDTQIMKDDGIQLFRLREQMEWEDKLSIRYVPKEYKRVPLFSVAEEMEKVAADYIEGMDTALILNENIDACGSAEELVLKEETGGSEYSRADMTNTGIPIYMKKTYERNLVYNWLYLGVDFYLYHEDEHQLLLLDSWKDSYSGKLQREYLWCEEIGGKVYTFQLFRLEDYAYIFEALLLEGNQARTLQREVWVPRKEIRFKEGDRLLSAM